MVLDAGSPTPILTGVPQTRIGLEPISSLCTTGFTPNIMTGVFTRALREHFADVNNLEFGGLTEFRYDADGAQIPMQELQNYVWSPDLTQTQILIDPVWKYNRQNIQQRPAVLVKRNKFTTEKAAIGDGYTVGPKLDKDGKVVRVRGRYQTRAIKGSHTIFSIAGSAAEAELLGAEVFNHFNQFEQVFRQELNLHLFEAQATEGVAYLEEFDDHFVVPVVVAYAFFVAWRIEVEAPWLKSLAIDIRSK